MRVNTWVSISMDIIQLELSIWYDLSSVGGLDYCYLIKTVTIRSKCLNGIT